MWTSHHALRWDGCLVESQEGLETKVGPRADLNSSVVATLMYLDSLGLPSYARNPHINSGRLVPRDTQISYSAAVDLVAELGVSQVQDVIRIDFCYPYFSDAKELHVPCKMDTLIIAITTERALRSLVL
ncbi:hypothetical protein M9H77_10989 [Catharanthus roseus]|uniref:Uncharacterized protein n=1 Tax=Catharanthus roseus TaxID=4058 RepID=A0ACC0BD73_CATRO|nr:hypothetical protein M9H77_10989 [Catharanthus roseus]